MVGPGALPYSEVWVIIRYIVKLGRLLLLFLTIEKSVLYA